MTATAPLSSVPTTDKPPRRRRWIPVSLRIFVVILLLLAIAGVVWVGVPAYRRRVAIREIEHFSGHVQYLHKCGPDWLRARVGDERMEWFDDPDHVVFWPDDANLTRRSRLGGVVLDPTGPQIDDAGLACLLGLPNLKSLDLAFSNVSDSGLKHVCRLEYLEGLRLEGSDVSDLSIPVLSRMRSLKELNVEHTQITKAGGRALEAALPGCAVQGPHNDRWERFR
jgi:hypothetical protein